MKIRVCPKCKTKEILNELKQIGELELNCINFCGIAKNKYVAVVNNKPIISDDKKEFINKIKEAMLLS